MSKQQQKPHFAPEVPLLDRIHLQTDYGDGTGCFIWTGPVAPKGDGYGHLAYQRKHLGAHRVVWEHTHGRPVPKGMLVCHTCDVRRCVRPDHLFLGTMKDNMADASRKGRVHLGEADGVAKLTSDAVRIIRSEWTGARGQITAFARRFGVCWGTVNCVVRGTTWKHVVEENPR